MNIISATCFSNFRIVFNLIVSKGRNNIESAYRTLESQGIFLRSKQDNQGQGGGMTKSQDQEGDLYTIN